MSEKHLLKLVKGNEEIFVQEYILNGPAFLKEKHDFTDKEWLIIFDHLVFEHGLIFKTINYSLDFFMDAYIRYGADHVREILDVDRKEYDQIWESAFDFLAISHDALLAHAIENREKYITAFRARGGEFLRKSLGISKEKYEESWQKILDFLLNAVCEDIFTESNYEHGLKAFALLANSLREHKGLKDRFKAGFHPV